VIMRYSVSSSESRTRNDSTRPGGKGRDPSCYALSRLLNLSRATCASRTVNTMNLSFSESGWCHSDAAPVARTLADSLLRSG
jgi:hypothetical protein